MRYQTPQFINIEDKVFGPFSFKQFVYLAGGAGLCYVLYQIAPVVIAIPLIIGIAGLAFALAFYKVNNRPFINFLQSAVSFWLKSRLYVWQKKHEKEKKFVPRDTDQAELEQIKLSENKLNKLSWGLDVLDIDK